MRRVIYAGCHDFFSFRLAFFPLRRGCCLPFKGHLFSNASGWLAGWHRASKFEWHNKCPHFAALSVAGLLFFFHPVATFHWHSEGVLFGYGVNFGGFWKCTFVIIIIQKETQLPKYVFFLLRRVWNKISKFIDIFSKKNIRIQSCTRSDCRLYYSTVDCRLYYSK